MHQGEDGTPVTMTISEVARQLRISRGSVYNLMSSGALKYITVGSSRRVTRAELHDYLERATDRSA